MAYVGRSVFCTFLSLAVLGINAVHAESGATSSTDKAIMHFTFRDSTRGTIVKPDAVLVDEKVVFNNIDSAGRMTVPVTPGDHRVVIKATGYNDLDSRQTAALDSAPMNLMLLDPAERPTELLPESLSQGMPADGTIIAGFITDDTTGAPIANADVTLIGKDVSVKTDEKGYFKLPVSMPDGKQMPEDPRGVVYTTRNFRVTKPGFGFEEKINVLLESGTPKIYQVALIRGGGGNSVDEEEGRNNLQSSLFGKANVEPEDVPTTPTAPEDRVVRDEAHQRAHGRAPADEKHNHTEGDGHSHAN